MTDTLLPALVQEVPRLRPGLPEVLPSPRGPVSEQLLDFLGREAQELSPLPLGDVDAVADDDVALALYLCYELHYLGLPDVDECWEWEPSLIRERRRLEADFECRLLSLVGQIPFALSPMEAERELARIACAPNTHSLSGFMEREGSIEQMRELAIHRSAYQLKEADPHTWAIPRLTGRSKAALVDIQFGEYGEGRIEDLHANLYAEVMVELGLEPTYGNYIDRLPGVTLSTCNLASFFGLHRRWRGALVGHLAMFEMCSIGPMSRYATALRRMGFGDRATRFYDVHVEADARHQIVALRDMVGGLLEDEPLLSREVVFGARAVDVVERAFAMHVLTSWKQGRTSLLPAA